MQPLNANNLETQDFFLMGNYTIKVFQKIILKLLSNKISDVHVLDRLFKKRRKKLLTY